jgi:hypothetical protein
MQQYRITKTDAKGFSHTEVLDMTEAKKMVGKSFDPGGGNGPDFEYRPVGRGFKFFLNRAEVQALAPAVLGELLVNASVSQTGLEVYE